MPSLDLYGLESNGVSVDAVGVVMDGEGFEVFVREIKVVS